MRALFEVFLLLILGGAVFLFYTLIIRYLYPKTPNKKKDEGFTLIELLIIISIFAILAAITYSQFQAYRMRNDSKYRAAQQRENCFNYDVEFPKGTLKTVYSRDIVAVEPKSTGIVLRLADGSEIRVDSYVKNKCF